jgi:thiamine-monophosphate kinase
MARKAVARVVSDLAAAGGRPIAGLCAAGLPRGERDATELFEAVKRWAEHFGMPLVGGDIASHEGSGVMLSITGIGAAHPTRGVVTRKGAKPGDAVYVTGALGGSFDRETGLGRHLTFEPRIEEAAWLCDTLGAGLHAMMDLSDGLGRDAGRLARASGVRLELESEAIPRHPGVSRWENAAGDGEDYELLVVVDGTLPALPHCCPVTKTPLTRIGRVVEAEANRPWAEMLVGGRGVDGSEMGYVHE